MLTEKVQKKSDAHWAPYIFSLFKQKSKIGTNEKAKVATFVSP